MSLLRCAATGFYGISLCSKCAFPALRAQAEARTRLRHHDRVWLGANYALLFIYPGKESDANPDTPAVVSPAPPRSHSGRVTA